MTAKDVFDKATATVALTALSPLIATISAINAITFKTNPFYTVERQGKDREPFRMIKFRSMDDRTDENGKPLSDKQRTHAWGKFLRATSMDELPQLINILKGDMSVVGPRPLCVSTLDGEDAKPYAADILSVKPGLTGPWQVAAIGTETSTPLEVRLKQDASYAKDGPSLTKDIALMMKTVPAIFKGHNGESLGKHKSSAAPKPRH